MEKKGREMKRKEETCSTIDGGFERELGGTVVLKSDAKWAQGQPGYNGPCIKV